MQSGMYNLYLNFIAVMQLYFADYINYMNKTYLVIIIRVVMIK